MTWSRRWRTAVTAALIAITVLLVTPPVQAAPPSLIKKCSEVEYRQEHLAECNRQAEPGFGIGGGRGRGPGGLLGIIRDTLGGLGGIL